MSTLNLAEFFGASEGMCVALGPHELRDTQARYLQDVLLDQEGFPRRRGPLQAASGVVTFTNRATGMAQTRNPQGTYKVAVLEGDASNAYLSVLSSDYSAKTQIPWSGTFPSSPYYVVDTKPALKGGTFIGTSQQYTENSNRYLGLWKGSDKATYSTGTITATRGSKTVTGSGTSFTTSVASGGFVFDTSSQYIGCIKSVDSNTQLTLEDPALISVAAGAYSIKSVRGINPRVVKGRITAATAAATVTGSNTKFSDQGLTSGTWDVYRARDLTFIGTVSSVTSNTSLTLSANAAVALDNERYVAIKRNGDYTISTTSKVGFLNAVYAERQWYANNGDSNLYFSDDSDPEAIDISTIDGDYIPVTDGTPQSLNTATVAISPAYNSLLVLKETQSFAVFGETPDNFELRKITDDGCLSAMSVQNFDGGVIYAGKSGIYLYDGVTSTNILDNTLGRYYPACIAAFDHTTYRMWSMLARDHYFLFIEQVTPNVALIKGNTSDTPTRLTIVIKLQPEGPEGIFPVTLHTNLDIRGSIRLPSETGKGTWFVINTSSGARVCAANDLFDLDAADTLTCEGNTAGPDFFFESKKFDFNHPLYKKLVKMLMLHYLVIGGNIKLDTIMGMNNSGVTASSSFGGSSPSWDALAATYNTWDELASAVPTWDSLVNANWLVKRIKFVKRSQYFQFRLYQSTSTVTKLHLGPFALAYKVLRPGRV